MHTISRVNLLLIATIVGTGLLVSCWFGIPTIGRWGNANITTPALAENATEQHASSSPTVSTADAESPVPAIVATATLLSRDRPAQALVTVNGESPRWYAVGDWVASWQLTRIEENGITFFDQAHNAYFDYALDTTAETDSNTTQNENGDQPPFAIPEDATYLDLGDGQSITFLPGTVMTPEQEEQQLQAALESARNEYDPGQSVTILEETVADAAENTQFH